MALADVRYSSTAIGMMTGAMVVLPEREEWRGPFPVFYLLHGLSDDHTAWARRTNIERFVQDLPLIVVMPNGGRGFYTNAVTGSAYETAIVRDLVGFIDRTFNTDTRREGRVIGGLSMGGYGATKLALAHPDLFCAATSHSSPMNVGSRVLGEEQNLRDEFDRLFGTNPAGGPNDLYALAEHIDRAQLPALRIDCGTDDPLLEQNREFHTHLDKLGIPHEYQEFPGAHTWDYWERHVQDAIAFHARILNIA